MDRNILGIKTDIFRMIFGIADGLMQMYDFDMKKDRNIFLKR